MQTKYDFLLLSIQMELNDDKYDTDTRERQRPVRRIVLQNTSIAEKSENAARCRGENDDDAKIFKRTKFTSER